MAASSIELNYGVMLSELCLISTKHVKYSLILFVLFLTFLSN